MLAESFLKGHWGPVVHGPGFGFRWDVLLFSFLERATLRCDIAQPIGVRGWPGHLVWDQPGVLMTVRDVARFGLCDGRKTQR